MDGLQERDRPAAGRVERELRVVGVREPGVGERRRVRQEHGAPLPLLGDRRDRPVGPGEDRQRAAQRLPPAALGERHRRHAGRLRDRGDDVRLPRIAPGPHAGGASSTRASQRDVAPAATSRPPASTKRPIAAASSGSHALGIEHRERPVGIGRALGERGADPADRLPGAAQQLGVRRRALRRGRVRRSVRAARLGRQPVDRDDHAPRTRRKGSAAGGADGARSCPPPPGDDGVATPRAPRRRPRRRPAGRRRRPRRSASPRGRTPASRACARPRRWRATRPAPAGRGRRGSRAAAPARGRRERRPRGRRGPARRGRPRCSGGAARAPCAAVRRRRLRPARTAASAPIASTSSAHTTGRPPGSRSSSAGTRSRSGAIQSAISRSRRGTARAPRCP